MKVNNTLRVTMCGPMFSLFHMMSNLFEFDIQYIRTFNLIKWNKDLSNKVTEKVIVSIKFWNKTLQHIKTKCWWVIVTIKVIFALKWHGLVSIWKQSVLWSRNGGLLTFLEVFWKKFEKKNRQRMHTPPYLWPQNLLVSQN